MSIIVDALDDVGMDVADESDFEAELDAELDSFEEIWGKKYPLSIKSWGTLWAAY